MGRNEEGGVLTQKLNTFMLAMMLVLTAGLAVAVVQSDGSSADTTGAGSVVLDDYYVGQGKKTHATVGFSDTAAASFSGVSWNAKMTDSKGSSQNSALSKSTGSSTEKTASWNIDVTAPSTAGDYTLTVTFTEKFSDGTGNQTYTAKAVLHVFAPIKLSVTVTNTGNLSIQNASVYFYVDGAKMEDSEKTLSVEAGKTATVTYEFYRNGLSHGAHTYYVSAGESSYNLSGLETVQTFYYEQDSQDYLNWVMGLVIVILLITAVWIFRKPVKNYGKPKARR